MNPTNNSSRFSEQDIEAVRRGFSSDHGRYIALMDLSHFLSNGNVEALLPAAEVVLNRPLSGALNPSMVELPTTSRNLDLDSLAPPAPPLPRMMKNLLKDRRKFQRHFVSSTTQQVQEFDTDIVSVTHKALENYQLKSLFKSELKGRSSRKVKAFAKELLFSTVMAGNNNEKAIIKSEISLNIQS